MNQVEAIHGDIVDQATDAIVNAADNAMRGGGGVDGAIHRAGGPAVLQDCIRRFPTGLATGDAGWTTAGNLRAGRVIHTVGPNFAAGDRDRSLLTSCYVRSLQVADELGARSVVFPLISAGVFGWPVDDAIEVAVGTLRRTPTGVSRIGLIALDESIYQRIRSAIPQNIGILFTPEPQRFGLRGDRYLWHDLQQRFSQVPMPADATDVRDRIVAEIERVVGAPPAADAEPVHVPAFDPGHGMSAGLVDLAWWYHEGLPLLLQRAR